MKIKFDQIILLCSVILNHILVHSLISIDTVEVDLFSFQ